MKAINIEAAPRVDPVAVERSLQLFVAPGSVTEIRALSGDGIWSGYFDSAAKAAKAVSRLGPVDGIYFTPSPVCDALLARRANRIKRLGKKEPTTSDADIRARRWFLVDSDPERPAGISSTDAEHEAALAHMRRVREGVRERGWPDPILADSGNGGHLNWLINLPNDEDSKTLCQRALQGLDELFPDETCKLDLAVFNAARIWKLYGTRAGKGDSIPDRPHRMARILETPDKLEVVTREQLEAIAEYAPREERHNGTKPAGGGDSEKWLREWIRSHNVQVMEGEPTKIAGDKLRWRLQSCPWNEAHGGDAAIILRPNGQIGARCFHNGCAGKGWRELRQHFEPGGSAGRDSGSAMSSSSPAAKKPEARSEPPPPYAPFPVEALPEPLRSLVEEGARAIGCDPTYVALPALVIAASTIGNSRRVLLKRKWHEPAVLWGAIVGESGTQKSPALSLALEPVEEWQAARFRDHKRAMREYEVEKAKYERDLAEWKKKKGGGEPPEKPEEPACDRVLVREPTLPALAAILETAPRGVVLVRDELSGWFGAMGQYHAGGASADSAYWLEAHRAGPWTIDRKTGALKIIHIPAAAVSVLGGIQPVVLQKALLEGTHYEDGLAPRLLLVCPPRQAKRWSEADLPARTEESVKHVLSRLRGLEMEKVEGEEGDEPWYRSVLLRLTDEARDFWVTYYNAHGAEQVDLSGALAAVWSKLEGYAARFALVFRLVRWANGTDPTPPTHVEAEDMEAAIVLAGWFGAEARRVYAILGESADDRRLRELVDWIQGKGGAVTPRELAQGHRRFRGKGGVEMAEAALDALVKAGLGTWSVEGAEEGHRPARVFRLLGASTSTEPPYSGEESDFRRRRHQERFAQGAGEEALRQAAAYQATRPPPPPKAARREEPAPVWGAGREPGDEEEGP